jgi:hypothetical protein
MDKETYDSLEPVSVDFNQDWVPAKAKKLKPQVFKDGDSYCCLFGPDPEVGIYGCGDTPENAILDWEKDLEKRMERLTEGDDAAHHAVKHLGQH